MKKSRKRIAVAAAGAAAAALALVIGWRIVAKIVQGSSPRRRAAYTVGMTTLTKQPLEKSLSFKGIVEGDPQVKVFSSLAGKFMRNAAAEGSFVSADAVIAYVSRDVVGQDFQPVPVRSPVSGMVKKLYFTDRGAPVTLDKPIAEVADPTRVKIVLTVGEADLGRVKAGQTAVIRSPYDPTLSVPARVFSVTPFVDSDTFSGSIIVKAGNADVRLTIGMSAAVDIVFARSEAFVVPSQAVQQDMDSAFVFRNEDGVARRVAVVPGYSKGNLVEITGDLTEGDTIVTDGGFKLFDGAAIAAVQRPPESGAPEKRTPGEPSGGSRNGNGRTGGGQAPSGR
ncbi:MAG: efflux RND transporter periplasmic adaptor subunit [Spirochaetales bacterium]|nr:efflux RND transporter periplasmic adaptor subunit [Spirochaetales bacterium]